jgi:hypothetical protein
MTATGVCSGFGRDARNECANIDSLESGFRLRISGFFRFSDFGLRIQVSGLFRAIWVAKWLKTFEK